MAATHINRSNVTQRIANARKEMAQQEADLKGIEQLIYSLKDGPWHSQASREYEENFRAARAEISKFYQALEDYFATMQSFEGEIAQVDEALSARLRQL